MPIILMMLLLVYPFMKNINYYFNILYLVLIAGAPLAVKSIFQFFEDKPMYVAIGKRDNIIYRYFNLSINIILVIVSTIIFIKLFL